MKIRYLFPLLCVPALLACNKDDGPKVAPICSQGYTGSNCDQQITPKHMKLSRIEVAEFPATMSGGASWDGADGPDVYVQVSKEQVHFFTSQVNTDVTPGGATDFLLDQPIFMVPNRSYKFSFYDMDPIGDNPLIGTVSSVFYNNTSGFPEVVTRQANGIKLRLYVGYVW